MTRETVRKPAPGGAVLMLDVVLFAIALFLVVGGARSDHENVISSSMLIPSSGLPSAEQQQR